MRCRKGCEGDGLSQADGRTFECGESNGGRFRNNGHRRCAAAGVADTVALDWGLPAGQVLHAAVRRMSRRSLLRDLDVCTPRIRHAAVRPPR